MQTETQNQTGEKKKYRQHQQNKKEKKEQPHLHTTHYVVVEHRGNNKLPTIL